MYCLSNFCFLCLNSHTNLISIKHCDRDKKTLHEKLKYCMKGLKYVRPVSETKLCSVCCDILRVTFEFQRKCLENNEKLFGFVQQLSETPGIYADALVLLNDEEYSRYKNKKPDKQNGGDSPSPSPENDLCKYLSMYDLIKLFPKKTRKENVEEINISTGNVCKTSDVNKIGAVGTSKTASEPIKKNGDNFKEPNSLKLNRLVLHKNIELINKINHFDELIKNEEKKQDNKKSTIADVLNNIIQKNLKTTIEENRKEIISSCLQFSSEELSNNKTFIKSLLTGLINAEKLKKNIENPPEKEQVTSLPTSEDFELLIASSPIIKLPATPPQIFSETTREISVVSAVPEHLQYKNKLLQEISRNFERKSVNLGSKQFYTDTPFSFYEVSVNSQGYTEETVRDNSSRLYKELLKRKSEVNLENEVIFEVIDFEITKNFWIADHDYAMKFKPTFSEPSAKRAKIASVDKISTGVSTLDNLQISNVQTVPMIGDTFCDTIGKMAGVDNLSIGVSTVDKLQISNVQTVENLFCGTAGKMAGVDNLSTGISTVDNLQISNVQTLENQFCGTTAKMTSVDNLSTDISTVDNLQISNVQTVDNPFYDTTAKIQNVDNLSTGVSTVDNLQISNVQTIDNPFYDTTAKIPSVDNLSTGISTVDNLQITNVQTIQTIEKPFCDSTSKTSSVDNLSTGVSTVDTMQISNAYSIVTVEKPIEPKKKLQFIAPKPSQNQSKMELKPGFIIRRCRVCSLPFMSDLSLKRHMRMHNQFHECSICHKKYGTRTSLKRHFKVHNDEHIFLCPFCPSQYGHLHGLKKHCEVVHQYTPSNFASKKVKLLLPPEEEDLESSEEFINK